MAALPDYAVSPGDHLAEWLEDNDSNAAELARRLDVTRKHVSELLSGKAPLSHEVALRLEKVTGIPARIWNNFEAGYREDLARLAETAKLEAQHEHAKKFPLSYLRTYGFILAAAKDKAGTVHELLALLGIAHLDAFEATWRRPLVAYRKTSQLSDKVYERATWLALGEREADVATLPAFDRPALDAALPEIRALTAAPDPVQALHDITCILRRAGVALVLVPPVPGFGVYGATRWISNRPLVQLSLRGKSDDQLWFSLFHELAHVLLHDQQTVHLQGDDDDAEREANDFARCTLIPETHQHKIPTNRDINAVRELAAELGIAPSIVLGQAQRLTGKYDWGHQLRNKLEWKRGDKE